MNDLIEVKAPIVDKAKLRAQSEKGLLAPNSPAVILELLGELEQIRADRKACWEEFKAQGRQMDRLKAEIEALTKERERLREDRDGLLEAGAHLL